MIMELEKSIVNKVKFLYGEKKSGEVVQQIEGLIEKYRVTAKEDQWVSEKDVMLITYGDSIVEDGEEPLRSLSNFLDEFVKDDISSVHILPFYPYTSDDGFSVVDYRKINPELGDWKDIEKLSKEYKLMFDAVINHMSKSSSWFKGYLEGDQRYQNYFIDADPQEDYSKVVRPRALPLLHSFKTSEGIKHIWTTFSEDQIDLNYKNPQVLLEIIDILLMYAAKGSKYIRLDAIGFMWKRTGTSCIHLEEVHTIIQLIRSIFEEVSTGTILITETNVPHEENISYFGDGNNEAHMVYQFPLPPLTLFSFHQQNARKFMKWLESMGNPDGLTTFFNFLASHDGIGMRPTEGILTEEEKQLMVSKAEEHGGYISYKDNGDGTKTPYELNINYFDALTSPNETEDLGKKKILAAHSILLALAGVPGIYIHSLLGSRNYVKGVHDSGINRRINRERLKKQDLFLSLNDESTLRHSVFHQMLEYIKIRKNEKSFHPQADQEVIYFDDRVFSIRRTSLDFKENILVLVNVSNEPVNIPINEQYRGYDLISKTSVLEEVQLNPYQTVWVKVKKED